MAKIHDLFHADRILRLMDAGLTFPQALRLDADSAAMLIEAWEIAQGEDDDEGVVILHVGGPE